MLSNTLVASLVISALAGYMYISIYGVLEMRAELRPEQLFIKDSDVITVICILLYLIPKCFRFWTYATSSSFHFIPFVLFLSTSPEISLTQKISSDYLLWFVETFCK
jgi:hypothetical protein